jgi:hypothetical protein
MCQCYKPVVEIRNVTLDVCFDLRLLLHGLNLEQIIQIEFFYMNGDVLCHFFAFYLLLFICLFFQC